MLRGFVQARRSTVRSYCVSRKAPSDPKDFYAILGVPRSATLDEIKCGYRERKMSHKATSDSTIVDEAYSVLSDISMRSMYDQYGAEALAGTRGVSTGASDVFTHMSRQRTDNLQQKIDYTDDKEVSLSVTLSDLFKGTTKKIRMSRPKICSECCGKGFKGANAKKRCSKCQGAGQEVIVNQTGPHDLQNLMIECRMCNGMGSLVADEDMCHACEGAGYTQEDAEIHIPLDSSIFHRDTVVVRAKAGCLPGGASGDLYVKMDIQNHPQFQRKGYDLLATKQISLRHALLGGDITVNHLDERAIVVRTSPQVLLRAGNVLLVRGEGMPRRDGPRGDLYITLEVRMPHTLDDDQQILLRQAFPPRSAKSSGAVRVPEILSVSYDELVEYKSTEWAHVESQDKATTEKEKISNDPYAHGKSAGRQKHARSKRKSKTQQCESVL